MSTEYIQGLKDLETEVKAERPRVSGSAKVFLDQRYGPAKQLASGCIYGIPDVPGQLADGFYKDIGFTYGRGGGSQLPGTRGWYQSVGDYDARFQSALSNYRTCRKFGAEFVLILPALWGADGGQASDAPYPGDGDDWSSWDKMISSCIRDLKSHGMHEGLVIDPWNEPDLKFFWNRPQEQWLQMWQRTYQIFRKELPDLRISGPCFSIWPREDGDWWNAFLAFASSNGCLPDQWSWHMEQGEGDMPTAMAHFRALLKKHNIKSPATDININEYGVRSEQVPSGSAWFIAQLERENAYGLRGNWAIAGALHDLLAGLVSKPNAGTDNYSETSAGYYTTAEYEVYKYYGKHMQGERLRTSTNEAGDGDVFAVLGGGKLRVLAGTRVAKGDWVVEVHNIGAIGLPENGSAEVDVLEFVGTSSHYEQGSAPKQWKTQAKVEAGVLRLEISQQAASTAYAFEVTVV